MPFVYTIKHMSRSWKLFLALLIGIILASTFFAGIDIKANATAKQALDQQLSAISVDMRASLFTMNITKMLEAQKTIVNIEGVKDAEIISKVWAPIEVPSEDWLHYLRIIGITNNSNVYDGWLNRPDEIRENETYIVEGSAISGKFAEGDVIQANISIYTANENIITIPLNLTVKGSAHLNDKAYSIFSDYASIMPTRETTEFQKTREEILIVSWEKTLQEILKELQKLAPQDAPIDTSIPIFIEREALITPWDMDSSINNIQTLEREIENELAALGTGYVQNNLEHPLAFFRFTSIIITFIFTLVSLPIFFMAWYMGTTVSNVSFNLRRREIGLLLTKGFSRGQILRTFLTETLLIGLIGGLLGVLFGFLLNPLFTQFSQDTLSSLQMISPYTILFTTAFGITIALLSTFWSAKRASQLPVVDALREYLPLEEMKPYKKRWPWVAFILGTYKITVFALGVNTTRELTRIASSSGNFILILLIGIFRSIDGILNYIGPLLFFWGFTKLFIQGSLKFQELTAKAAKFLGELGVLATKNVRRNPARSAAIAFLIALIVGYSVQVTGQLASEQDYTVRQTYYNIGADVAIDVVYVDQVSDIVDTVMTNVSEYVQNVTIEYSFSASLPAGNSIIVKAVQPQSWLETAYYEDGWFSGKDVAAAFNHLSVDKNTIILERRVSKLLNLEIGGNIALNFGNNTEMLEVVGFFGPESVEQQQTVMGQSTFTYYWSFVSEEFYEKVGGYMSTYERVSTLILLKLNDAANGKKIAENIRSLSLNIGYVESFAEEWEEAQTDIVFMGVLDVQRLGIIFAVLAASVGTALVSTVSMKERSREATIMSVKGLSYKQLVIMFLTENLALVIFSIVLGLVVGLIVVYGNMSATNAFALTLVQHRLVFPLDTTLMLALCITLIFISTILPIIIMSRKYVTQLERMIRLR